MEPETGKLRPAGERLGEGPSGNVLRLIMVAILIWGALHALGAYLFNWDWRKPVIILACSLFFLGGWWLLLRRRQRQTSSERGTGNPQP